MTTLLALAIDAMKRLPPAAQDEMAIRVLAEISKTEREEPLVRLVA